MINQEHLYNEVLADKSGSSQTDVIARVSLKSGKSVGAFRACFYRWKKRMLEKTAAGTTYPVSTPPAVLATSKQAVSEPDIKEKIRSVMKTHTVASLEELSDTLDAGIGKIRVAVQEMIDSGHNFRLDGGNVIFSSMIPKSEKTVLNIEKMSTGLHKFGAIGDNHMCSKYERNDVLNAMYDEFQRQGITTVYNTGNWIDGEARFNKHDLSVHGMDNQIDYFIKNYPQRAGVTTYFIAGDDHEGWYTQREGIDIGKYTEFKAKAAGRDDLIYIGYMEADVSLPSPDGETVIRVLHPGGGSSYATSYTAQKIVESYQGGEKPHILLIGHYHKAEYLFCRGVHCVQTGTTQDQSPFMRKKRLAAHVGGWIIEFGTDDMGAVTRFRSEFFPFYDNDYYRRWNYKFGTGV